MLQNNRALLAIVLLALGVGIGTRFATRPKPRPAPTPPTRHVTLRWEAVKAIPGVTSIHYNVYRRPASERTFRQIASQLTDTTYEDDTAVIGTTYVYAVSAIDQRGWESRYSTEVEVLVK